MKKIKLALLSLLMLCSLTGCMNNDKKEDSSKDKTEEKDKDQNKDKEKDTSSISDVMSYMKENGIDYSNDKTLSDFDWAAKEGTSFRYNDQDIYLYKVDSSNSEMNKIIENVKSNNMITANQNGTETDYAARVNGNYLLIYDKEAAMDELVDIFNKYKVNNSETDKENK